MPLSSFCLHFRNLTRHIIQLDVRMDLVRCLSLLFTLLGWLAVSNAAVAQQAVIVGGGGDVTSSEVSIERNTRWIYHILAERYGDRISLAYTDGGNAQHDVYLSTPAEVATTEQWIHFAINDGELLESKSSEFLIDPRPAHRESVQALLSNTLSQFPAERVTLIYQGHGDLDEQDTNENVLRLWNHSSWSAREFSTFLDQYNQSSEFRFVFPQCYSGSFANVIFKNMEPANGLTEDTRCGFVSQLDFLTSEGCTPSVQEASYRDYSTYFFEALGGMQRTGEPLLESPDYDENGEVTMREAHLYTLRNALSLDFSRSTSEVYLEHWQDWFTRWLPSSISKFNDYYQAAQRIAEPFSTPVLQSEARSEAYATLSYKIGVMERAIGEQQDVLEEKKIELAQWIEENWPDIYSAYLSDGASPGLVDMSPSLKSGETDPLTREARTAIQKQLSLLNIISAYLELEQLIDAYLNLERQQAQLSKIEQMLNIARLQTLFSRFATESEKNEYRRLLACEELPL
ncbi:hypothetical protein [Marinibactrum halimedae]|uniref:Caspase family protein n=1 Tax=Marinibactrum halimedae TaxID=1444977 RepID=A0AA37WM30_9GAMM|nr:hypothetical protein [Marinibactrum halimedae]MCD9460329.1 hypothetical protein [Marinibactrum halimedae]GLS26764.1 hypothetical protein GCM10007877_24830 [Marinibactrum halimedae]